MRCELMRMRRHTFAVGKKAGWDVEMSLGRMA
jgi:hypothetical protein